MIRSDKTGDSCIIYLEGRIDSNNAPSIEAELMGILDSLSEERIVLDASDLAYISSAGLRILMKARKRSDESFEIINVSRDIYEIFETTGFTELFRIKKAYRSMSIDGLEVIGQGFFGTVYRIDEESIVKVYKGKDSIPMIENEKRLAQKAFLSGIPTAISYDIVKVGEDYGSVFELLNAKTFHELAQDDSEPLECIIEKYVNLIKQVHATTMDIGELPSCKKKYLDYLEVIKKHLYDGQYRGIKMLLDNMEESNRVVHGDIQMKNVMLVDEEAMLIDMDSLGLGNPVFELAGLFVTYQEFEEDEPDNSMNFLGMTQDKVDKIWQLILRYYFFFTDESDKERTVNKIRLAAALRFLFLIETTDLKDSDLGRLRIRHTAEHIDELLPQVNDLSI